MGRGKHKDRGYGKKRQKYAAAHPKGDKKGGRYTKQKRNVKQAGEKRRLGEKFKA